MLQTMLKQLSSTTKLCYLYNCSLRYSNLRRCSTVSLYSELVKENWEVDPNHNENIGQSKINLTDQELSDMYDKYIYNTETWKMVLNYKTKSTVLKNRSLWKNSYFKKYIQDTLNDDSKRQERMFVGTSVQLEGEDGLQSSYKWQNELSVTEVVDPTKYISGEENFPFAYADVEKIRDKLKEQIVCDSKLIQDIVGESTTPDTPTTFSTDHLGKKTEDIPEEVDPNMERIYLEEPFQKTLNRERREEIENNQWKVFYGTPDPKVPMTNIPCSGCGAQLHCQNSSMAGYLPSEIFKELTRFELLNSICQRCTFLKEYNVALNLSVDQETYPKIISKIKEKRSLIILMVDLLDFPCSIWSGLIDLIGANQPIIVVANKVDLLPKEGKDYLDRVKTSLSHALKDQGIDTGTNIKNICLISAKTGYGVEELISDVFRNWARSGDVYLVGCTNVGKSTLFNSLLQSDLCKVQALDLVQKATVSVWPGTTLNLLKFPILRPTFFRMDLREKRLKTYQHTNLQANRLKRYQLRKTKDPHFATLSGHIGLTFQDKALKLGGAIPNDEFKLGSGIGADLPLPFNPNNKVYTDSKWLYDTPGTIYNDQIISLLTGEELRLMLPSRYSPPRCFIIKPKQTILLAGLGRVDYVEGSISMTIMVFSSPNLPVTVLPITSADEFYEKYLGTDILKVPRGSKERLKSFPKLVSKEFSIQGEGIYICCADVVLSSAGWMSFVLPNDTSAKLLAYTPDGRGCHLREPALLKYAPRLRGQRIGRTPACEPSISSIDEIKFGKAKAHFLGEYD